MCNGVHRPDILGAMAHSHIHMPFSISKLTILLITKDQLPIDVPGIMVKLLLFFQQTFDDFRIVANLQIVIIITVLPSYIVSLKS